MKTLLIGFISIFFLSIIAVAQTSPPRIVINSMGHSAKVQNLLFTPDGGKIISVSEDKSIRLWNVASGEMIKKFESQMGDGPEGMLYASAISSDGKLLAVSGFTLTPEKQIYIAIIDLEKSEQVATAIGHTGAVNSIGFSGDGRYLISGSDDGTVKIWHVEANPIYSIAASINVGSPVKYLAVNQVTMDVAVAAEKKNNILVYNVRGVEKDVSKFTPRQLNKHKGEINKLTYSADGKYLASSNNTNELVLWKADGSVIKELGGDKIINAIAFSQDSKILVGLDESGKGISYSVKDGSEFTEFGGHDNTVFSAAFSPLDNGSYVVASAGGNNNEIFLWNPISGKTIRKIKGKGRAIQSIAFGTGLELFISYQGAEKGRQYKSSFDFNLMKLNSTVLNPPLASKQSREGIHQSSEYLLDLPRVKQILNDPDEDGRILDYHNTLDGNVLVASDFSLKMYTRDGNFVKEFVGHIGGVRTVTISPDGRYIASGGEDQTIILWKVSETGAALSLRQHPAFNSAEWAAYFSTLPCDSLTKEPSKESWKKVIDFLKVNGDKTYKAIDEVYKNLGETVLPFATLFVTDDNEWVCWAHKGYFACSSAGSQYFGWHLNRGVERLADFYAAEQYFDILYRPKQMEKSITQARRVEDILKEEGERIFDLSRLQKPSAGIFNTDQIKSESLVEISENKMTTKQKSIPVSVDVLDGGGGVKEVNIFLNDKLVLSDNTIKNTANGQVVNKTYNVDLVNGDNEFKVVVVNYQKIESRPDILKIEYTGELMAVSNLHVLIVGINKYQNAAYTLNYAQPDAKAFVDKISSQGQRIFKSINKVEIYDERATKENIIEGFKSIAAVAKPEDVFMFFYAGHGSIDEANKDAEGDAPFYFVPTNVTKIYGDPQQLMAKGFSAREMREHLMKIKSTKQIVLMDACHSGGAVKNMRMRSAAGDEQAIVQLARSSGVVCLASSGTKQYAAEFDILKHGVFTYALLEALDGKASKGDGKLTVNELKSYMDSRVPELTKLHGGEAQYPTGYLNGSDFPIAVIGDAPPTEPVKKED